MTRRWWRAVPLLAAAGLAAGCGSQHTQAGRTASLPPPPSLALSASASGTTWASLELGGSAADFNNFWQLFARPSGTARWRLATPPGMASNGGFALAGPAGQSFLAAFRPSQNITYSPLVSSADSGAHWSTGQVAARLADVPDALATGPASGGLLALTTHGVELSRDGGSGWASLATRTSLAATVAGRKCGLARFTAAAFTSRGTPLAAGACARPGVTGIFARSGEGWQAAGPTLPAALAGQPVTVLRLSIVGRQDVALFAVGSEHAATVVAGWVGRTGRWVLSPGLRTHGRRVLSASLGPDGSVGLVVSGSRGETVAGPGASWRSLTTLPADTQTLVLGPGTGIEALAGHQTTMTVWALGPGPRGWARKQVVKVPIPYGSSG
jgi:hypothetical protein